MQSLVPAASECAAKHHLDALDAQHGRLIPAALSRGIGSDSQRPFAIVIVGGLMADLLMCIFILPTLYVLIARNDEVLPVPDASLEV